MGAAVHTATVAARSNEPRTRTPPATRKEIAMVTFCFGHGPRLACPRSTPNQEAHMSRPIAIPRRGAILAGLVAVLALAVSAASASAAPGGSPGAVYTSTNSPAGNAVVAFHRGAG